MKKGIIYIITGLIAGVLGYFVTLYFIPYLVMSKLEQRMETSNQKVNEFFHSPLIDATSRSVVRPNPDFLYSITAYDLSAGSLKIKGQIPDSTYWSIAFYQDDTVNYYVKNDQAFEHKSITLILVPKGTNYSPKEGEEVIQAPTEKGMILTRLLLPNREEKTIKVFQDLQKTFQIELLKSL